MDGIACGSFSRTEPAAITGSGYVGKSLEAVLWAFFKTSAFVEGCLAAVNLGDDADTTAAIYGQIAGAYYGINEIPRRWRDLIALKDTIESLADGLYQAAIPSADSRSNAE